jgi:hypothetical protein
MDTSILPNRPGVAAVTTAPRPTPKPVRVPFSEVMTKTVVAGAESAVRVLPGGPMMAVALRGGNASLPMSLSRPMMGAAAIGVPEGPGGVGAGPGGLGGLPGGVPGVPGVPGAPGTGAGTGTDGGIESSLAQSQEMNLYYLQIQEEVNAQNRSFSALSNVLKAEHDTVKTAIGNIR